MFGDWETDVGIGRGGSGLPAGVAGGLVGQRLVKCGGEFELYWGWFVFDIFGSVGFDELDGSAQCAGDLPSAFVQQFVMVKAERDQVFEDRGPVRGGWYDVMELGAADVSAAGEPAPMITTFGGPS